MRVGALYSHKDGFNYLRDNHRRELLEVVSAIRTLSAEDALCKQTSEKTKKALLFSPEAMNETLKRLLCPLGWTQKSPGKKGFREPRLYWDHGKGKFHDQLNVAPTHNKRKSREYREMDGIKNRVGLEIQFGKYAFMGYDIFSKMPIFKNAGFIDCGIEVVAMPSLIPHMSTGVSSFSQIVMDMKARGVANLDLPTLVIGIDCRETSWPLVEKKRKLFAADPASLIKAGLVRAPRQGAKPGPK